MQKTLVQLMNKLRGLCFFIQGYNLNIQNNPDFRHNRYRLTILPDDREIVTLFLRKVIAEESMEQQWAVLNVSCDEQGCSDDN